MNWSVFFFDFTFSGERGPNATCFRIKFIVLSPLNWKVSVSYPCVWTGKLEISWHRTSKIREETFLERLRFNVLIIGVIVLLLAWAFIPAEMKNAVFLWTDAGNMAEFGRDFLRPNFHEWEMYIGEMIVTLQIAMWGTAISILLGIQSYLFWI